MLKYLCDDYNDCIYRPCACIYHRVGSGLDDSDYLDHMHGSMGQTKISESLDM